MVDRIEEIEVVRLNQIVLITDGCSNTGTSPAAAARHAYRQGITVNVIGIVDGGDLGERGAAEAAEIAQAGGGLSRIVSSSKLAETVQMLTRQTVVRTVQQAVQEELRQLLGTRVPLAALPPETRGGVVRMIDHLSETSSLKVALLIDTSASMRSKLHAVADACRDLLASLRAREGHSEMCVFRFPGQGDACAELLADWTANLENADELFYNLNMKGTTPTGPAILKTADFIMGNHGEGLEPEPAGAASPAPREPAGDGVWSGYIV
jgi:Ca-activated chloride channel family protein